MDKLLQVLLIEDEDFICQRFKKEIENRQDIELIGITNNSHHALELVQECSPDAIILDLELHYGKGNGVLFLQELQHQTLSFSPYILITTNNSSPTTHQYARENGADFIMYKHQDDYSEQKVVEFLCMMSSIIFASQKKQNPLCATTESPIQKEKRLRCIISKELDYVGINPKSVGYQYLIEAILIISDDPKPNFTSIIAKKHKKTPASIERGIQNAINRAWNTTDIDDLFIHYTAKIHSSKGVPTINEFVYYYANKIRNEH